MDVDDFKQQKQRQKDNEKKQSSSPESRIKQISSASGPWLHAWYDPMAHLRATSCRIVTVDITNDGNHALLVVDDSKRLKVFRGMNLISSHKLLDHASCLSVFHPSSLNKAASSSALSLSSSLPAVGVGTGSYIYIYRSMRPYYKFTLPSVPINGDEAKIWNSARCGDLPNTEILSALQELEKNQNPKKDLELSFRTMFVLSIVDKEEQLKYIETYKTSELVKNTCITCMTSINKEDVESHAVSSLIVGTENNQILFLDSSGSSITKSVTIPSVPVMLSVIGLLAVDYRVIIATRSATIYTIRNTKLLGTHIELESNITAMAAFNKNIIVSCLNKTLYAYHIKGNNVKLWSLYFKSNITAIEPMIGNKFQGANYFLVGFGNGDVAMYNNNIQLHVLKFNASPITALKFGKYGREECSLIILNESGCLNVKIMSRRVNVKNMKQMNESMKKQNNQQDNPLNLPPITQLYLDQEVREKENAENMYKIWQKEIVKFRLKTNNEYIKVLKKGNGPLKTNNNANNAMNILLNVQVIGVGPWFTLQVQLKNVGKDHISNIVIVPLFDTSYYQIKRPIVKVPLLIPSLSYKYEIMVKCVEPNGGSKEIQLALMNDYCVLDLDQDKINKNRVPFMTAIVDMPFADMEDA